MKAQTVATLWVVALFGFVILHWTGTIAKLCHGKNSGVSIQNPLWSVESEIGKIVADKRSTGKNVADISPQLARLIEADPRKVLICLVVAEANHWPRIGSDDEERILDQAKVDSVKALADLSTVLHCKAVERMIQNKENPTKENCRVWHANNRATALLFIEFPIAQELGKERLFLKRELEGYREGAKEWWEPEMTRDQFIKASR